MVLTQRPVHPYRSLQGHEVIRKGDLVEDVRSGRREHIGKGFYGFLSGCKANEARELPGVYDVVRHVYA